MASYNQFLKKQLNDLKKNGIFRDFKRYHKQNSDFFSNDYLGFARSAELYQLFIQRLDKEQQHIWLGSTGSRLISGNHLLFDKLEKKIACFHKAETGLLCNSGYHANLSLLSSIPQKKDAILYDAFCHASIPRWG